MHGTRLAGRSDGDFGQHHAGELCGGKADSHAVDEQRGCELPPGDVHREQDRQRENAESLEQHADLQNAYRSDLLRDSRTGT